MTKPPAVSRPSSRTFFLRPVEVRLLLEHTRPQSPKAPDANPVRYLTTTQYRRGDVGPESKCPAARFPSGTETNYTKASQISEPLFAHPRSITATTIDRLRAALQPHAVKHLTPATTSHICVEIRTDPLQGIEVTAWDPFKGNKPTQK